MASKSDRDIIEILGIEALKTLGHSEYAIKKWMQRGIPWRERAKVATLAGTKRVKLPSDFLQERRAA